MSTRSTQFDDLYECHYRMVLAYCLRRTAEADAHDAASEVFVVAWRRLDDVPTDDKQLAWLYGVARRVLSRQWRGARRFSRLVSKAAVHSARTVPDVAHAIVPPVGDSRVLDALELLRPPDQEILRLAAWEGLSHAGIAETLGVSVAAVDQRLHRAKKRLAVAYENIKPVDDPPTATKRSRS
jgi:RNA polymerase sigma-70 factor (ECF subfamily)